MSILEIFIIGVGLSMDAFAVSVCKGLSMKKLDIKKALIIAIYFGVFQALMPLIGYVLGVAFSGLVESIDHWISFILLSLIGINMIKESLEKEEEKQNDKVDVKTMFILAIATSIDALAVGVTFAFLKVRLFLAVLMIGLTTFVISFIGVKIGKVFGDKLKGKAELLGGIILIIIGLKILLEHMGVL